LGKTDALILDVRFNGGGKDEVGMEIIRHFNPTKQIVFNKKAKFRDSFTAPNSIVLNNAEDPYTKPVYLLTSQQSASATEIMVLSSLLLEHVTRMGAHTEGVFSDVLDKVLPNEWEFGLSNEVYLDTKGINYEGKGIPVDVSLDYPEDRQTFFRQLVENLEGDRQKVLELILNQ
jgi:C-terminal processing protease CtpA/Prc